MNGRGKQIVNQIDKHCGEGVNLPRPATCLEQTYMMQRFAVIRKF